MMNFEDNLGTAEVTLKVSALRIQKCQIHSKLCALCFVHVPNLTKACFQ